MPYSFSLLLLDSVEFASVSRADALLHAAAILRASGVAIIFLVDGA